VTRMRPRWMLGKEPFMAVNLVVASFDVSQVVIEGAGRGSNEPPENSPEARACFWWRRGRVELPLKRGLVLCLLPQLSAVSPTMGLQPPVTIWG
jgi:hypothetical protein